MRIARILVNETCDHRCAYCNVRRDGDRAGIAGAAGIRERIDAALAAGVEQVIVTGGEPTLRPDLGRIVAYAAGRGAGAVVLETNAVSIDAERAAELASAGVARARVHTPAWGAAADRVTGMAGGFERALAGMRALAGAGIAVDLTVPVVRANAGVVAEVPAGVAASDVPVDALWIVTPFEAPEAGALLELRELTAAAAAVAHAARQVGLAARFEPSVFVPPCAFERPEKVAHLYAMTPGGAERLGYARAPACADCSVADRCPGIPEALAGFAPAPIRVDRVRRRLSIISTVEEQIERELTTRELYRREDGTASPALTVRVNFHCNQSCHFCFVSTHLPPPPDEAVRQAILSIAREGGVLVLSGGEPTLNPKLLDYVRLGRAEGAREIELQTNAIRLGEGSLAQDLVDAGVTDALVSLHGATADVSDYVTDAPGTFDKTVRGLDALARTSCRLRLNFVFCQANVHEFPGYIDMVSQRWPGASQTVSFVAASTDVVPQTRELIPRYSEVLPFLREGVERARRAGVQVTGFESMCGVPLCLVPGDLSGFFGLPEIPEGFDRGEFLKVDACAECALAARCFGIRRGYAELHGTGELRAVARS